MTGPLRLLLALAVAATAAFASGAALAQRQKPDLDYRFQNESPAYAAGSGPKIAVSTANSRYVEGGALDPFANLAEGDGFQVERRADSLADALAGDTAILVIANPFMPDFQRYPAMTPPSAFSEAEIEAIRAWVEAGGSLLLLADHAPLGGGSSDLAKAFGFEFLNGHAVNTALADQGYRRVVIDFTPENGLNTRHPITDGGTGRSPIAHFYCFGGQAFIPPTQASQLLTIPSGWSAIFTYRLAAELGTAMRLDASGLAQGATLEYGAGRIAIFGEAGAFSAQVIDGTKRFGFNTPEGSANPEFILATLRWLARFEHD